MPTTATKKTAKKTRAAVKADTGLAKSHEKYAKAFMASPDSVTITSLQGRRSRTRRKRFSPRRI